jgi:WD40 repeat protein
MRQVSVWSLRTGQRLAVRRLHAGSIEGLSWNAEHGLLASCSSDCTVAVVSLPPDAEPVLTQSGIYRADRLKPTPL